MGKMHQEGVTLIELLVTLAVGAIIIAIGVPAVSDFFATNRMSAASNDLVSSLHLARSEAIKRGTPTRLCATAEWDAEFPVCDPDGSLADGWLLVADPNAAAIIVQRHEPLHQSIRLKDNLVDWVEFDAGGEIADLNAQAEYNLLLCDERENRDMGRGLAAGRLINVRGPGRPRIFDRKTDVETALGGCGT